MNKEFLVPKVTVVIAVHSAFRPIARAVMSAFNNKEKVKIIVVAHNIYQSEIEENLIDFIEHDRLTIVEYRDDIKSPAGPFNYGISLVETDFYVVLGSDDELSPGAIDYWLSLQKDTEADVVIARQKYVNGNFVPVPPVRIGRKSLLHPIKDRLIYQSAPLGLVSKKKFVNLRFSEGFATGEDILFTAKLMLQNNRILFAKDGPEYLIHSDAVDRVTFTPRSVGDDLSAIVSFINDSWYQSIPGSFKTSCILKLLRINVFSIVYLREDIDWSAEEREQLAHDVRKIVNTAPNSVKYLSVTDSKLLKAILNPNSPNSDLSQLSKLRTNHKRVMGLFTPNPIWSFSINSPLRLALASWFLLK